MLITIDETVLSTDYKIVPIGIATSIASGWKKNDWEVGILMGSFDIVHLLHWRFFNFAKKHCSKLIVAINSNESVRFIKGVGRPFFDQGNRAQMVASNIEVDLVIHINIPTNSSAQKEGDLYMAKLITEINPDIVFSNPISDYQVEIKKKTIENLGGQFGLYEEPDHLKKLISSSKILEKLNSI